MKTAPLPPKEKARASAVKALRLIGSAPEERFDRITRLSQRLFNMPMVAITLLDGEREWYKSATGLSGSEVPGDISFGSHAILEPDVMSVADASLDDRFHDNPLVTGAPGIRFYAACPLTAKSGAKLGVLCLMDRQARHFTDDDRALLRDLAQIVEKELQDARLGNMDALTCLSNRSGFEDLCQLALNICRRFDKPATLLHFNIQGLTQINQQYGRGEGDLAIKSLGQLLIRTLRASDVVGRLDQDEFVVLMTDTTESAALSAMARLNAALDDLNNRENRGYKLAYSVGLLQYKVDVHPSITGLLGAADMMMFERKRQRRKLALATPQVV